MTDREADPTRRRLHVGRRRQDQVRQAVAGLGRLMIVVGVVLLLFVAYQLWGTGLREQASQRELRAQLEEQFDRSSPEPRRGTGALDPEREVVPEKPDADAQAGDTAGRTPTSGQGPVERVPMAAPPGEAVAILKIPKLGLDKVVVEGTDVASLRKGPGHEPGTSMPGMPGNAVIAGHRTTYGAPFYHLDELAADDQVVVETPSGPALYIVTSTQVVDPDDVWILEPTDDDRLTLFTCTPRFSAARRLVVTARLAEPPPPPLHPDPTDVGKGEDAATVPANEDPPSVEELAAPTGSVAAAGVWSIATILLAAGVWWAGRRYGRLTAYAVGAPLLTITLFTTFERVGALLPSAV